MLAAVGAELVCGCWHVARLAELGAGGALASGVNSASQCPPKVAASCASVAGLNGHGEPGGDVVGFEDVHLVLGSLSHSDGLVSTRITGGRPLGRFGLGFADTVVNAFQAAIFNEALACQLPCFVGSCCFNRKAAVAGRRRVAAGVRADKGCGGCFHGPILASNPRLASCFLNFFLPALTR